MCILSWWGWQRVWVQATAAAKVSRVHADRRSLQLQKNGEIPTSTKECCWFRASWDPPDRHAAPQEINRWLKCEKEQAANVLAHARHWRCTNHRVPDKELLPKRLRKCRQLLSLSGSDSEAAGLFCTRGCSQLSRFVCANKHWGHCKLLADLRSGERFKWEIGAVRHRRETYAWLPSSAHSLCLVSIRTSTSHLWDTSCKVHEWKRNASKRLTSPRRPLWEWIFTQSASILVKDWASVAQFRLLK